MKAYPGQDLRLYPVTAALGDLTQAGFHPVIVQNAVHCGTYEVSEIEYGQANWDDVQSFICNIAPPSEAAGDNFPSGWWMPVAMILAIPAWFALGSMAFAATPEPTFAGYLASCLPTLGGALIGAAIPCIIVALAIWGETK